MKKLITLIMILICAVSLNAQNETCNFFASKIITEVSGVIDYKAPSSNGYYCIFAKLPSYYNLELVVTSVKLIADRYSDVIAYSNWEKSENKYTVTYIVDGKIFSIFYQGENAEIEFDKNVISFVFPSK